MSGSTQISRRATGQTMAKKRPKVSGKNKFPGILVRANREGQLDEWRSSAARSQKAFQDWAREALDREARK
jgi:hypothetical protein